MRIRLCAAIAVSLSASISFAADDFWSQILADPHSVQAVQGALQAPIPADYLKASQDADDELLKDNNFYGQPVYLVTDEKLKTTEELVTRLLNAMGEDPSQWVVRVLDSDPKISNAFVTGGKYVYVFTGTIDQAQSQDELAFVLGHEIGHSMLKHEYRRSRSVVGLVGAIAGAMADSERAQTISTSLTSAYGQDDEREADAIGATIARRAGFDPMRGADFFTRMIRAQDKDKSKHEAELSKERAEVERDIAQCKAFQAQYGDCSDLSLALTDCSEKLHQVCSEELRQRTVAYNAKLNQDKSASAQQQMEQLTSTHPPDRERVASIAALNDVLRGKRAIADLGKFQNAQRVMMALSNTKSVLLAPSAATPALKKPVSPGSDTETKLKKLDSLRSQGLITQHEYEEKRKAALDSL